MEQAWENYHHKLRARMSNLIERYAQPQLPQIPNIYYSGGLGPTGADPGGLRQPFVPQIQTHAHPICEMSDIQRVPSPALDRVAKNLPEIVIEPISMKMSSEILEPTTSESSSSIFITILCWILGFCILALLAVAIYFGITLSKMSANDNEEDEL